MIKSMTGFGRAVVEKNNRTVTAEIKSVNHKYYEPNIRLPKNLFFMENDIRKKVNEFVFRGKTDIFITYANNEDISDNIECDMTLAARYKEIGHEISEKLCADDDITVAFIMRSPGVIRTEEAEEDEDTLKDIVLEAVTEAAKKLVAAREVEGSNIYPDLCSKLDLLSGDIEFISDNSDRIIEEYKSRITEKMEEMFDHDEIDESRIAQEMIIYSDKVCIDEEIVRLRSHIGSVRSTLDSDGPIGRKLDFIIQELNRETNTITSKSSDIEITNAAVSMKTTIEKIREQVQNIE